MAAKSKLTPELLRRLTMLLRAGNFVEVATEAVGITKETFYQWLKRGQRDTEGVYHEFATEVHAARAQAECRAVAVIAKASEHHWQAAAWFLERSAPGRWGRTSSGAVRPDEARGVPAEKASPTFVPVALSDALLTGGKR